jgi:hypothetical protein
MRSTKNNPRSNMLRSGTSEEMVLDAIKQSGYPLQLEVANLLKENFEIEEEWAFPDSETNTTRTIDIVATPGSLGMSRSPVLVLRLPLLSSVSNLIYLTSFFFQITNME